MDGRANPPGLFETLHFRVRELGADEVPLVQSLFDANPDYFIAVNGRSALADEAATEFAERPPAHLPYGRHWFAGVFDPQGCACGVLVVVADLGAPSVWHLTLLWLATTMHGQGRGRELYLGLEDWARGQGAAWLRLAVVRGNARAERFWQRQGFVAVRKREGIDTGGRINTLAVMVKPLGSQGVEAYLERVPRDRPGSTLP